MKKYELEFGEQLNAYMNVCIPVFCFVMMEKVNGDALKKAVIDALAFHPVFATKMVRGENGQFWLEENTAEPVVCKTKWEEPVLYGTKEMHEFPWVIMYDENRIRFTSTHALTDGNGALAFLNSVLGGYLYQLGKLSKDEVNECYPKDIAATTENSMLANADFSNVPLGLPKPVQPTSLAEGFYAKKDDEISLYRFILSVSDVMKKAKTAEVTTAAVIGAYIARAIERMIQLPDGNIQLLVAVNLRGFFGSTTDHNFTHVATLNYPIKKCSKMPVETVNTIFRSQLDLKTDKTNLINECNNAYGAMQALNADCDMLKKTYGSLFEMLYKPQASCVYTHLTKLPLHPRVIEQIENFEVTGAPHYSNLLVTVGSTFRDKISLMVSQSTKNDSLIKCMKAVMEENSIPYTCEKIKNHGSTIYNPDIYRGTEFYTEQNK